MNSTNTTPNGTAPTLADTISTPGVMQPLRALVNAVVESVAVAGDQGAPAGVLYSALMAHGCSHGQFTSLMAGIVQAGLLRSKGHLYFVVKGGAQ